MRPQDLPSTEVEDLAAEFLAERAADARADEHPYLARLKGDADRELFQSLVAGAQRAERSLPRALIQGTLLCGRYRIVEEIGSGGMGRVFAAFDIRLERTVAVKVLSAINAGHAEREEMFMKESRLLATLQHPGIVAVHEAGRDEDLTYIVMDFVDGVSLDRVIERGAKAAAGLARDGARSEAPRPRDGTCLERAIGKKLPHGRTSLIEPGDWYRSVARIALEIARTIEAAHGAQVIHRDLKPANVMLLGGGNPVVLDFGLAGSQDTQAGAVTRGLYGSVAYLAPEQAESQEVGIDPRTDVYQLGLILYELLTLRRAFPGQAIGDVMERIRHGDFAPPRSVNRAVPSDLEAICMMALELEPARRYGSARELREDFERYLDGGELPRAVHSSRMRALARSTRHTLRRHPWRVAIAGMVAVAIAVGLVAKSLRGATDGPAMQFFALDTTDRGAAYRLVGDSDPVREGDILGASVQVSEPTFVYALSVFVDPAGKKRVAPSKPGTEENPTRGEEPDASFGLALGPGEHRIFVTRVAPPEHDEDVNRIEGVYVWSSADVRPELETLLANLQSALDNSYPTGVPFEDVKTTLLAVLDGTGRGALALRISEFERAAMQRDLRERRGAADAQSLGLRGTRTFAVECRVEPVR